MHRIPWKKGRWCDAVRDAIQRWRRCGVYDKRIFQKKICIYIYDICINIHSGMQNVHVTNIHTCICVSVYISICICILSFWSIGPLHEFMIHCPIVRSFPTNAFKQEGADHSVKEANYPWHWYAQLIIILSRPQHAVTIVQTPVSALWSQSQSSHGPGSSREVSLPNMNKQYLLSIQCFPHAINNKM